MAWNTPVKVAGDLIMSADWNAQVAWLNVRHKNWLDGQPSTLTLTKDNNGVERYFFKDDFSNNTIANYTLSGSAATIAAGIMSVPATGVAYKTITAGTTGKWEGVVEFTAAGAGTAKLLLGDAGTSYVIVTRIVTTNRIWLELFIGGVSKIANTDTTVTLADNVFARVSAVYDGTSWQMAWNGTNVGANTAAITVTTPIIGVNAGTIASAWDELTYLPSVAWTDPMTADWETRYMQLASTNITIPATTGTWAACAAGDVVEGAGIFTLASADDEAICTPLRSYNFASGEIEFSFDCNNDGGGGADETGYVFGYQDILNHYQIFIHDSDGAGTAENLKIYKIVAGVATQLGTSKDVTARYAKGTRVYIKLQWSRETGQMWAYMQDNTGASSGLYPTTPDISDAFSTQFSYGKAGAWAAVTTVGAGNLNVAFYPATIRAALLVGETNVPATETGFYLRDEFTVDSSGRYTKYVLFDATGAVAGGVYVATRGASGKDVHLTVPETQFSTVTIEGDFVISAANSGFALRICMPTTNASTTAATFYDIRVISGGADNFKLRKGTVPSTITNLTLSTKTITAGVSYHVKLTFNATTGVLVGYLDAATITATDATLTSGYAGVYLNPETTAGDTVTCDNLTISGTRYYMKPMLCGAQIGEYYNGAATVQATRFTDDFNWNDIDEYAQPRATWSINTIKGELSHSSSAGLGSIQLNSFNTGASGYIETQFVFKSTASGYKHRQLFLWDGALEVGGSPSNGVHFGHQVNTGAITLSKWVAGSETALDTGTLAATAGNIYTLKTTFINGAISASIYENGVLKDTLLGTYNTRTSGYVGIYQQGDSTQVVATNLQINALDSTSTNGVSASLGGVPHGARYDTQEECYETFVNAAQNGEYLVTTAAKSTYPTTSDFEYYFINYTDTTAINWEGQTVAALTPGTTYTDGVARSLLREQDVADTVKLSVRRKNYSGVLYDNQAAVFIKYLGYVPVWEV